MDRPPARPKDEPSQMKTRIALVALVIVVMVTAHQPGILEQFAEPARVKQTLVALGPWGYVAFVGAYAMLQPFGMPGTVFVMAAPLIWPWPTAFALSMTGTMAASVVGFSFSRFVARDWIAQRIPERFRRYEEALERRAFATVVLLRFVFWMPPPLHAFFGVSRVRFSTHFWGSLVGYAVPLFLVSYFGEKLFEILRGLPPAAWIATAAVVILAVATWALRGRVATACRTR